MTASKRNTLAIHTFITGLSYHFTRPPSFFDHSQQLSSLGRELLWLRVFV
jgi:hypothetical protein